ncbi:MAG: response regulator [Spirulinaceae cyanobacterium]
MSLNLDTLVAGLRCHFSTPRQVAIIGSTSFWQKSTEAICYATGRKLAALTEIAILTGGVSGIPEAVSRSFYQHRQGGGDDNPPVFHVQPQGFLPWDYGHNLTAGQTLKQRRFVLAHAAPIYLLLEGGPGTEQEARWALGSGGMVLPVGCTGGFAKTLYEEFAGIEWQAEEAKEAWQEIGRKQAKPEVVATGIALLIAKLLDQRAKYLDSRAVEAQLAEGNRNFQRAWLENTSLDELDLQGVNLHWATLKQVSLQGTDLTGANLQGSIIVDCQFIEAIAHHTKLNNSQLIRTTFQDTNLKTADMTGVVITEGVGAAKANSSTLLVIDDSITVRELLDMTFTKAGYNIIKARDGKEAWELLQEGLHCDAIFADIEMPRMDGYEFLKRLKKSEHLQGIPVAILTSRGINKMIQPPLWQQLGAWGHFTKPYAEETIIEAANCMVRGKSLEYFNLITSRS